MDEQEEERTDDGFGALDEFLEAVDRTPAFDPSQAVIIRTMGGNSTMVPLTEPASIVDVLKRTDLAIGANVEYWVDQVAVQPDFVLAPGATLTIIGVAKAG